MTKQTADPTIDRLRDDLRRAAISAADAQLAARVEAGTISTDLPVSDVYAEILREVRRELELRTWELQRSVSPGSVTGQAA